MRVVSSAEAGGWAIAPRGRGLQDPQEALGMASEHSVDSFPPIITPSILLIRTHLCSTEVDLCTNSVCFTLISRASRSTAFVDL